MWLNLVQSCPEEQLYCNSLLSLFSLLTELMDLHLKGKAQGLRAPAKLMIQDFFKVGVALPHPFWCHSLSFLFSATFSSVALSCVFWPPFGPHPLEQNWASCHWRVSALCCSVGVSALPAPT